MARKTMWAVAGALLAFAPLASAATYGVTITNAKTYASEVISSGDVQIDYRGAAQTNNWGATTADPRVTVHLNMNTTPVNEVAAIDNGDVINVTFTLANAKFGRNVRDGDMSATTRGAITDCSGRVRDTEDGERGQSEVTFEIEAADDDCAGTGAGTAFDFHFDLPRLEGLNKRPVTVTVSTDRPGGSGWVPTAAAGVGGAACATAMANAVCHTLDSASGNLVSYRANRTGETGNRRLDPIIEFASGLTFSGTSGGASSINLAAGRTSFTPPLYQALLGNVTVGVSNADMCTGAAATPRFCNLQADGRPFSIARGGEGRGDLVVNVSGDFRNGDTVYLDLDGNWRPGTGESLRFVNGSMEGAFDLLDIAGNARAAEGDAGAMDRAQGVGRRNLLYAPNGRDALRPGGYRSSYAVNFAGSASDKGATPASSEANTHTTQYTVVEDQQVAYAIPPGTTGDVGSVRVKCEVATQCTVYLECDHADGRSWFSQVEDPIAGRSTLVLTSEGMRTALDMDADDWTRGRMSCTVYSTREISLQVLTRSTTGVLVNNTYVDD